ncbi:MAG: PEP-CTERM sorting domain-containing protein [Nitrospinae bacterium]|nr:PEP-CTERM sorting domain-containing protein [Nitrospinota bacterium]
MRREKTTKELMKHLTLGAILGLGVMAGGVGQANATPLLNGQVIETTLLFPDTSTAPFGSQTDTVVAGVEIADAFGQGVTSIDFSDTNIKFTALNDDTLLSATFNGFRFFDVNGTITPWAVSINLGQTNVPGFDNTRLTFDENTIFANFESLVISTGQMVSLDLRPVPEPSTMFLMASGLAGLAAWRLRKQGKAALVT